MFPELVSLLASFDAPFIPPEALYAVLVFALLWESYSASVVPNLPTVRLRGLEYELRRTRSCILRLESPMLHTHLGSLYLSLEKQAAELRIETIRLSSLPCRQFLGLLNGLSYSLIKCEHRLQDLQLEIEELSYAAKYTDFSQARWADLLKRLGEETKTVAHLEVSPTTGPPSRHSI